MNDIRTRAVISRKTRQFNFHDNSVKS